MQVFGQLRCPGDEPALPPVPHSESGLGNETLPVETGESLRRGRGFEPLPGHADAVAFVHARWSNRHVGVSARESLEDATVESRAEVAPPATAVALPDRVLAFQRSAGNAAVGHMLARPSTTGRIQRCGASCHCERCRDDKNGFPDAQASLRSAVMARKAERHLLRWDWPFRSAPAPAPNQPDAGTPDASTGEADAATAPDNPSVEQDPAKPIGVCGPDVTKQVKATLSKIEQDFEAWSKAGKKRACVRIFNPIDLETAKAGGLGAGDLNGWDTYGLFSGLGEWLRRPPVCPPCATPSSTAPPGADWRHKGHEDPRTCSNTVQVGNGCWLAGTVNYATFGIMVRLCAAAFSEDPEVGGEHGAREHAKTLIRGYKTFVSKEDPKWPLAWTEEVYRGGPGAITTVGNGNRAGCSTTCGQQNPKLDPAKLVSWDYVWEPIHTRVPNPKPAAAPAPAPAPAP